MNLASCRRLAILGQRFKLGFDELAESAILETFNDGPRPLGRHVENSLSGNETARVIHFTEKRSFFNRRAKQSQRTYRGSAHIMGWHKNSVPDTKPQLDHQFPPRKT